MGDDGEILEDTGDFLSTPFTSTYDPATVNSVQARSLPDKMVEHVKNENADQAFVVSRIAVKRKQPQSSGDHGCQKERAKGLEPSTSSLGSGGLRDLSDANKGLTSSDPAACTAACTSGSENANGGPVDGGSETQDGSGEQLSGTLSSASSR